MKLSSIICVLAWCNVFGLAWFGLFVDEFATYHHATMGFFLVVALLSGLLAMESQKPKGIARGRHQDAIKPSDN